MNKFPCVLCRRHVVIAGKLTGKYCDDCRDLLDAVRKLDWNWYAWARRNDPELR